MKFIDEAKIKVKAGNGGDGIISFRREYRIDKGGPDGGDGGRGGCIYFIGDTGLNTLMPLKYKKNIIGNDGEDGKRKKMYGAKGQDIIIKVPIGTMVYEDQNMIADIQNPQKYLIAKGGKGGKGNVKFKTARNTAPKLSEKGKRGEKFELKLVLKILADVGFVGKPSAGKSTLLSKITNAKPKIASYEFTTLVPQLGIVNVNNQDSFVAADLPGLIKGASQGKGLGYEFLRHIERCCVIGHIIDFGSKEKKPVEDYKLINYELRTYSKLLLKRTQIIIANKNDNKDIFNINFKTFQNKYPNLEIVAISALKENNLSELKFKLFKAFKESKPIEFAKVIREVTIKLERKIIIKKLFEGMFKIEGEVVEDIYNKIPLTSWENFQRFNYELKKKGVWNILLKKGIKEGDTVRLFGYEFTWTPEEY